MQDMVYQQAMETVSYERVIIDELEVSEAVPHPGGMCKVHADQGYPRPE